MKLTKKLLGLLHRVFDIDPDQFLALRIRYDGAMSWVIADAKLTTTVSGGIGANLSIDLTKYTLRELVSYIASQPGYSVPRAAGGSQLSLGARALIGGGSDQSASNGDHLYAYSSLTWAYMEACAVELQAAAAQIPQAIRQMSIPTAEAAWLDELGNLYGVHRQQGELDASYGPRIIAEVVRPRSNNVAIEKAISYYTGQATKVTDVVVYGDLFPLYNGQITRDSQYRYQTSAEPQYGLFDVQYGYDLLSGTDQKAFALRVRAIIERIRAAGTHLRSLSLQAGAISDTFDSPTDGATSFVLAPQMSDALDSPDEAMGGFLALRSLEDALDEPADSTALQISTDYRYNSTRSYNGAIYRTGGTVLSE